MQIRGRPAQMCISWVKFPKHNNHNQSLRRSGHSIIASAGVVIISGSSGRLAIRRYFAQCTHPPLSQNSHKELEQIFSHSQEILPNSIAMDKICLQQIFQVHIYENVLVTEYCIFLNISLSLWWCHGHGALIAVMR